MEKKNDCKRLILPSPTAPEGALGGAGAQAASVASPRASWEKLKLRNFATECIMANYSPLIYLSNEQALTAFVEAFPCEDKELGPLCPVLIPATPRWGQGPAGVPQGTLCCGSLLLLPGDPQASPLHSWRSTARLLFWTEAGCCGGGAGLPPSHSHGVGSAGTPRPHPPGRHRATAHRAREGKAA